MMAQKQFEDREMDNLSQELRRKLKRGYPEGELKEDLRNKGYDEESINKILFPGSNPDTSSNPAAKASLLAYFSIGLLILGIALEFGPPIWLRTFSWPFIVAGTFIILVEFMWNRKNR